MKTISILLLFLSCALNIIADSTVKTCHPNTVITFNLATNWTGANVNGKEPGIITTNHIATITYLGIEHVFQVTNIASDRVVWRINKPATTVTNIFYSPYKLTNFFLLK